MFVFSVILEGEDDAGRYFVTFDVSALDADRAGKLAMAEAERRGLRIVGLEECAQSENQASVIGIIKTYGKSYFGSEP